MFSTIVSQLIMIAVITIAITQSGPFIKTGRLGRYLLILSGLLVVSFLLSVVFQSVAHSLNLNAFDLSMIFMGIPVGLIFSITGLAIYGLVKKLRN